MIRTFSGKSRAFRDKKIDENTFIKDLIVAQVVQLNQENLWKNLATQKKKKNHCVAFKMDMTDAENNRSLAQPSLALIVAQLSR